MPGDLRFNEKSLVCSMALYHTQCRISYHLVHCPRVLPLHSLPPPQQRQGLSVYEQNLSSSQELHTTNTTSSPSPSVTPVWHLHPAYACIVLAGNWREFRGKYYEPFAGSPRPSPCRRAGTGRDEKESPPRPRTRSAAVCRQRHLLQTLPSSDQPVGLGFSRVLQSSTPRESHARITERVRITGHINKE